MRKPKPSLYLRFRQPDGKQSSYCRAIFDGKSRLRPFWCLVRGTEEHHPEATYYQRTKRDGKGAWESLGTDPAAAWNKATVGKSVDTCKQELAAQRTPPEPAVTTDSYRINAEVKTYLSNVEKLAPKTHAAYKLTLDVFQESCSKIFVHQVTKQDLQAFDSFLLKQGHEDRTRANRIQHVVTFLRNKEGRRAGPPVPDVSIRIKYVEQPPEAYTRQELEDLFRVTPANGAVKVRARLVEENPSLVVLEVSDSGCGIRPEMTERIFERLFQASDPAVAGRKGLGLGLYICKDLVARQGGQICAKSAPGQGTVFSVTLPIFSLSNLIAPAFRKEQRAESPITLVVTEMGSQTGWLSDEVRAEQSSRVRDLLRRCLYSDLDVLLPKMGFAGAVELFFIVASTDRIGGEAIGKRIREQLDDYIQQTGLTLSTSYQSLDAIKRNASDSMEEFREKVATNIQKLMNEEMSSRMVENG